MNYQKYELLVNTDFTVFEFISSGKNGEIQKAIKYTQTLNPDVYNLGFGDIISYNEETGEVEIDDDIVSNNGDIAMILATVAYSAAIFIKHNPNVMVLFGSSNAAKLRLYRMAISRNFEEISKTFHVFGAVRNDMGQIINVPFEANDDFIGFFVRRSN
jgi:hypothetical protein